MGINPLCMHQQGSVREQLSRLKGRVIANYAISGEPAKTLRYHLVWLLFQILDDKILNSRPLVSYSKKVEMTGVRRDISMERPPGNPEGKFPFCFPNPYLIK